MRLLLRLSSSLSLLSPLSPLPPLGRSAKGSESGLVRNGAKVEGSVKGSESLSLLDVKGSELRSRPGLWDKDNGARSESGRGGERGVREDVDVLEYLFWGCGGRGEDDGEAEGSRGIENFAGSMKNPLLSRKAVRTGFVPLNGERSGGGEVMCAAVIGS